MAQLTSSLVVRLVDKVSAPARGVAGALRGLTGTVNQIAGIAGIGRFDMGLASIAASLGGIYAVKEALTGAVGAASRFESAMADVRKVVDFESPAAFKRFQADVIEMSKRLPMAAGDLSRIVAAAGQAGIASEDLLRFTELAAKVGVAFDISAETTGESLAKMMTGLGLTIDQVSALTDAMNHLSNSQASSAADILDVVRRAGADGKLFGFTAVQTSAFASAMLSAGAESDVAATSFRNMGRALTRGSGATGRQVAAMKKLGLTTADVAKSMQKDAVTTTVDVLERINQLPAEMRASIASDLFGDEARALMPLISNLDLLKKSLGLVSDETRYLGSAAREYEVRSKTFANNVQLFKNNVEALGIAVGNALIPILNRGMAAITPFINDFSDVMGSLDQRIGVFDRLEAAITGFLTGLGIEGGTLRDGLKGLYDALFGSLETVEADAARMWTAFSRFREMGEAVRDFGRSIAESIGSVEKFLGLDAGAIADVIGTIAGYGFKLAAASVGISLAASALLSLGRAIMFVTGITAIGKLAQIMKIIALGSGGAAVAGAAGAGAAGAGAAAGGGGLLGMLWRGRAMIGAGAVAGAAAYGAFAPMLNPTSDTAGAQSGQRSDDRYNAQRVAGLQATLAEIEGKIAEIRAKGGAETEIGQQRIARYAGEAAKLRAEIDAINGVVVKPEVDGSSIDDALGKTRELYSLLQRLGPLIASTARAATNATHGVYADLPDGQ